MIRRPITFRKHFPDFLSKTVNSPVKLAELTLELSDEKK